MFGSLRFRLLASFAAIVLITLAAAGLALYARMGSYRNDLDRSTLRQVASPIYYNLALFAPVADGQGGQLAGRRLRAELLEYLRVQNEAGVAVLLIDADGRVIRESTSDERLLDLRFDVPPAATRGPDFTELPVQRYSVDGEGDLMYVIVPTTRLIRAAQGNIYAVVVALPENSRREVFRDLAGRLLFAGGIALAAAAVVGVALIASLYRPLGKVTAGVRAVAAGRYGDRVPVDGPREIRALATDVNTMADSVQDSQRMLREFLANVSHELRTPLTSIRGFSQAMLDGTLESPEERARAARVIDIESRRVLHLVGELLDLSRIESGQQKMELARVSVADLLAHVRDVFALRAEEAGISFHVTAPAEGLFVRADFDRIEQVLGNLLDNAFRHTPSGGRIDAGARGAAGGFIELYVADNGGGVAPEDLPHVFDRFYRSQLGGREMPGTGLGLAISREIVRAHGGAIRASAREGGGSEFAFTLRAHAEGPVSEERAPSGERRAGDAPAG